MFGIAYGKTTESVHCCTITDPCLHMRHRPSSVDFNHYFRIFILRILYTLSHHFRIIQCSHFIHVHFHTFAFYNLESLPNRSQAFSIAYCTDSEDLLKCTDTVIIHRKIVDAGLSE